jgi:hypothetical protein
MEDLLPSEADGPRHPLGVLPKQHPVAMRQLVLHQVVEISAYAASIPFTLYGLSSPNSSFSGFTCRKIGPSGLRIS